MNASVAEMTMEQWLARPWSPHYGENCILVNRWGLWAIMDCKKVGPFRNEHHLHAVHPEFALQFCGKL